MPCTAGSKLCLIIRGPPLGFLGITFCVRVRFWCPIAKMKATDMPLHMLLDLNKNIYFSKSYSRKLFVVKKTQLVFLKKIFSKNFSKNPKFRFLKKSRFRFFWKVNENRKFQNFEKPKFWIFEKFFEKYFFELSFFDHKKFSAVTFRKINIFI